MTTIPTQTTVDSGLYMMNRGCHQCKLRDDCAGPVPATGPMNARVAFVGEAPGQREDETGEGFTGDAGQYLNTLLKSIGLEREDVLITNTTKCRPKGNRTPTPAEAKFCAQRWLDLEMGMVKPEIIVAMGSTAIRYFLGPGFTVEHTHGIPLIVEEGKTWTGSGAKLAKDQDAGNGQAAKTHKDTGISDLGAKCDVPIESPGKLPMDQSQQEDGFSTNATIRPVSDPNTSILEHEPTTQGIQSLPKPTINQEKPTAHRDIHIQEQTSASTQGPGSVEPVRGLEQENAEQSPKRKSGIILLPVYHPASGFYDTSKMREIQSDFQVLGELLKGKPVEEFQRVDEYPEPVYEELSDWEGLPPDEEWALDTETVDNKLWSVQVSGKPGTGIFINPRSWKAEADMVKGSKITVHNYLYDAQFVNLPKDTDDSMLMAYLLGLPQGLKELSWRLCGMEMESYTETISGYRKEKALAYLNQAILLKPGTPIDFGGNEQERKFREVWKCIGHGDWFFKGDEGEWTNGPVMEVTGEMLPLTTIELNNLLTLLKKTGYGVHKVRREKVSKGVWRYRVEPNEWSPDQTAWPLPPVIEDVTWNKAKGVLEVKRSNPHHITKKMKGIVADVVGGKVLKDGPVDAYVRWNNLDSRERACVEEELGEMPDASMEDIPPEKAVHYACRDADATGRIKPILYEEILKHGLRFVYELDRGTLPIAHSMMQRGFKVDPGYLRMLSRSFLERMEGQAEVVFKGANVTCPECSGAGDGGVSAYCAKCQGSGIWRFNPNSDNELRKLFFEYLGFKPTKYTETNLPSVARGELAKIKHPVVKEVETYRHLAHLRDSFCEVLPDMVDENDRLHGTIKVTRTATGRWSMADPNPMQIPARSEDGRLIRKGFICEEGNVLLAADYSQIEMRMVAHLAQCMSMIKLFKEDRDIHTETAAEIFGIRLEDVTDNQRKPTKNIGFGIIYLETEYGLESQMARENVDGVWGLAECKAFIQDYYRLRPELKDWQDRVKSFARLNGWVSDMVGRVRWTPEVQSPIRRIRAAGERQAVNMPVQGGAQAIIKMAMVRLWEKSPDWLWWVLQVHDELVWELPEQYVEAMARWIVPVMEGVVRLSVPVKVEAKAGKNWIEMEKVV